MSKCACDVAAAAACCATGCLCHCLNARPSLFRSRTRSTTVRHRRDCFLEWKLRLLPLLHSVVLAAARRCSLGAMILRGQTVVVVVTVSLVAVDFLFWTPESERASELARPSTVRLLHCTPLLPPLSPVAPRKAALPINWCMTIVTAP